MRIIIGLLAVLAVGSMFGCDKEIKEAVRPASLKTANS